MDEIKKIPPVTRYMLASALAVTVPCMLMLVDPRLYVLVWPAVTRRWEIWRLYTAFFYGGTGLPYLFDLFMLYRNSNELEVNAFYRRTADYVFSLLVVGSTILALNYPLRTMVFWRPLLVALTYLWSRHNPNLQVSLFGLINIPSPYWPYTLLAMDFFQGGAPALMSGATGIVAAHLWWYLDRIRPARFGGRRLLSTPAFLRRLLPDSVEPGREAEAERRRRAGFSGAGITVGGGVGTAYAPRGRSLGDNAGAGPSGSGAPASVTSSTASTTGYRWGRGHRLGDR